VANSSGASTVRQYLSAGLIDELRLHVVPVMPGAGERLLEDIGNFDLEPLDVSSNHLVTNLSYRVPR
jgi:dihydrofolate reductase